VDLPATLTFGKAKKGYDQSSMTILKFTPWLGKLSISASAHSAAHRLFRERQGSMFVTFWGVKSTLGWLPNYLWRLLGCLWAFIGYRMTAQGIQWNGKQEAKYTLIQLQCTYIAER
jgi:hypothetical protein